MKKTKIFFLIILSQLIINCSSENTNNETDSENNEPKLLQRVSNSDNFVTEFIYDDNDILIEVRRISNDELISTKSFIYDNQGFIMMTETLNSDNVLVFKEEMIYTNDVLTEIQSQTLNPNSTIDNSIKLYYTNSLITEVEYYQNDLDDFYRKENLEYDEDGNIISLISDYVSNTIDDFEVTYLYDEFKNPYTNISTLLLADSFLGFKIMSNINNSTTIISTNLSNNQTSQNTYTYEYDSDNFPTVRNDMTLYDYY